MCLSIFAITHVLIKHCRKSGDRITLREGRVHISGSLIECCSTRDNRIFAVGSRSRPFVYKLLSKPIANNLILGFMFIGKYRTVMARL